MVQDMGTLHVHSTVVKTEPLPGPGFKDRARRKVSDLAWRFNTSKVGQVTKAAGRALRPAVGFVVGAGVPILSGWLAGWGTFAAATALGAPPVVAVILAIWLGLMTMHLVAFCIILVIRSYVASRM